MVVVPTSKDVHLTYERSRLDYAAYLLTFLGIAMLIFMRIRGDVRHANTHPFGSESDGIGPPWDDFDGDDELADPTPAQRWQPGVDESLESRFGCRAAGLGVAHRTSHRDGPACR